MENNKPSSSVVLKSGLWYTISNFAFRAVAFITTPIFARILTQSEYGQYNNFASWISLLVIFATLDVQTSVIRAKLDFENDLKKYTLSALVLSSTVTILFYVVFLLNQDFLADLMGIEAKYFHIMFIYIFFISAYNVYITYERANYRYKLFSLLTGLSIVGACLFSLVLVLLLPNKLDARIYGWYLPYAVLGFALYCILIKRGKGIKLKYIKYALSFNLPLIPHLLSMELLSSSDRIMITRMCGAEFTAIYSIAYIVSNIMYILLDSMNKAWAPWFLDTLKSGDREVIKKSATPYFSLFVALILCALFIAPELILILGGSNYMDGIYVLPPLIVGVVFQFVYTMYVQVEYYEKKVKIISIATIIAAALNIVLNFVFIPIFGFAAAGYTTMIGYICLLLIHYHTARSLGYGDIFDKNKICFVLVMMVLLIPVFIELYSFILLRYLLFVVYLVVVVYALFKNKNGIIKIIKRS